MLVPPLVGRKLAECEIATERGVDGNVSALGRRFLDCYRGVMPIRVAHTPDDPAGLALPTCAFSGRVR